jgi:hypothetical protein
MNLEIDKVRIHIHLAIREILYKLENFSDEELKEMVTDKRVFGKSILLDDFDLDKKNPDDFRILRISLKTEIN